MHEAYTLLRAQAILVKEHCKSARPAIASCTPVKLRWFAHAMSALIWGNLT